MRAAVAALLAAVASHDIEEAAASDYAILLAQRIVAFGRGWEVLPAEALLSTFGLAVRYAEGGVMVFEYEGDHHPHDQGAEP